MDIVNYDRNKWGILVTELFAFIYPNWEESMCNRMAYDEKHPLHIFTLLAIKNGVPIGQLNLFRVEESSDLVNIGYHVHPFWQRQGVASALMKEALQRRDRLLNNGLVIQTNDWNTPSQMLAIKYGFTLASEQLINQYRNKLKCLAHADGVCLHLP